MLIFSMSVSVDGFVADRDGDFQWHAPDEELVAFHHAEVQELGAYLLGRRLYETMLVWETDPAMRATEANAAFADFWCALPKVVFSTTLDHVRGAARLATGSLADEVAATQAATDRDVSIGGTSLAAQAFELGLVDEVRVYRCPVMAGGGTPFRTPVGAAVALDLVESRRFASGVVLERYQRGSR